MQKEVMEVFRVHYKWSVFEYAKVCRNVAEACREFERPRSTFYRTLIRNGMRRLPKTVPRRSIQTR